MIVKLWRKLYVWYQTRYASQLNLHGIRLKVDRQLMTKKIIKRIVKGRYEKQESLILSSTLEKDDVIVEIGGGIGYIANLCSQYVPGLQIHTFEANPQLIDLIKSNRELNGADFQLYHQILTYVEDVKVVDFYLCEDFYSSSTQRPTDYKEVVQVPAASFVNFCEQQAASYLIMDVEGYEYEFFANVQLPQSVRKVCLELHPQKSELATEVDIPELLQQRGFTIHTELGNRNNVFAYR